MDFDSCFFCRFYGLREEFWFYFFLGGIRFLEWLVRLTRVWEERGIVRVVVGRFIEFWRIAFWLFGGTYFFRREVFMYIYVCY